MVSVGFTFTNAPTSFIGGDSADTIQFNVANTSIYLAANSSLTFSISSLGGLTPVTLAGTNAGTGWTCNVGTLSCTRTTPLNIGASDPITLTVSVPAGLVPVTGQITASLAGGGLPSAVSNQETVAVNPSPTGICLEFDAHQALIGSRGVKQGTETVTVHNTSAQAITGPA